MLKKQQRLGRTAFSSKASRFRVITTPYFSIRIRKNDRMSHRFAFVISKKIDKRAVVRNSLKRRMTVAVATLPETTQGYDYIFYMKKSALELSVGDLEQRVKDVVIKERLV